MADVFISYSRKDMEFVRRLHDALSERGQDTWLDWDDIPISAEWMADVRAAIEEADNFVFVISPKSAASEVCAEELAHAVVCRKRILPVLHRETKPSVVPKAVAELNWQFMRAEDDFGEAIDSLDKALRTDLEWVSLHTRLFVRATEWKKKGRDGGLTLRGAALTEAEDWLSNASARSEPEPTTLHSEFILASRKRANVRKNVLFGGVILALAVMVVLWFIAEHRRRTALSRQLAAQASLYLYDQLDLSLLLSLHANETKDTVESRSSLVQGALQADGLRAILHGDRTTSKNVAVSPDGKLLASGMSDGCIALWDLETGSRSGPSLVPAVTTQTPYLTVYRVAFSSDGGLLASAGTASGFLLWSVSERRLIGPLIDSIPATPTSDLAFSPDGAILATTTETSLELWDVRTRTLRTSLDTEDSGVFSLAFTPDGRTLASGGREGIGLWDPESGEFLGSLPRLEWQGEILNLAISPDGQILAAGGFEGIALWLLESGELLDEMAGFTSAFSPVTGTLAVGLQDGSTEFWEPGSGESLGWPLQGSREAVTSVTFTPDERTLVAATDHRIFLWDVETGELLGDMLEERFSSTVSDLEFRPDGTTLLASSLGDGIGVWDVASPLTPGTRILPGTSVTSLAFNPAGTVLAVGTFTGIELMEHDLEPQGERLRGEMVAFDRARSVLASTDMTGISFYDAESYRQRGQTISPPAPFHTLPRLVFGPDGRSFVSVTRTEILLWDRDDLTKEPLEFEGAAVAYSPDDRVLAIGAKEGISFWDLRDDQWMGEALEGAYLVDVSSLDFSPDGHLLASASRSTAGDDEGGYLTLWDVASRLSIGGPIWAYDEGIEVLEFSPDGTLLATGGSEGLVVLWDTDLDSWKRRACRVANRRLTSGERDRYIGEGRSRREVCAEMQRGD